MLPERGRKYQFTYGSATFAVLEESWGFVAEDNFYTSFAGSDSWFKIAIRHTPVYSTGTTRTDASTDGFLFENAGGDIWYYGHIHTYYRTHWLKSGLSGGQNPVDVSQDQKPGYAIYCSAGSPHSGGSTISRQHIAAGTRNPIYCIVTVDSLGKGILSHKAYVQNTNTVYDSFKVTGKVSVLEGKTGLNKEQIHLKVNPNPFQHSVWFHINMPKSMKISLSVFDINGKEVVRLADNVFSKGEHIISLNESARLPLNLPSGLYICRLKTPAGIKRKIFMKMK
jgi:hypothetical protein